MAFKEFDEIWAGDCEGMLYSEIRERMPRGDPWAVTANTPTPTPMVKATPVLRERVQRGLAQALFLAGDAPLIIVGHQAINRMLLSLFLRQRNEDVPFTYIPQNQYYHISLTPRRKVFERIPYDGSQRATLLEP